MPNVNYVRIREALYYAQLGWRVFPCHTPGTESGCSCREGKKCESPGKHPRINKWQIDATISQAQITEWWGKWPEANIGILTGPESGLIVVDVDAGKGGLETLLDLTANDFIIPDCPTVMTGGGGRHFYLAHPGFPVQGDNTGKVGIGIDVKADGGFVVAPNSYHFSGNTYTWEESSKPRRNIKLPLAPYWLLECLIDKPNGHNENAGEPINVTEVGLISEGKRNATLTSLAGYLRRKGFSADEIAPALLAVNQQRCVPPLSEREVMIISESMEHYKPSDNIGSTADRFQIINAAEAFETIEPMRWVVKDLIPEVGVGMVVGEPGSKKTYSMIDLAVCVAKGFEWLGHETTKSPVIYVDEESGKGRALRRLRAIMAGHLIERNESPAVGILNQTLVDPRKEDDLSMLSMTVKHFGAKLVIIDALADIMAGADENSVKDVQPIMIRLRQFAEDNHVAVLLVHHTGKSGVYRGSSALKAAVDLLLLVRSQPRERIVFFEIEKTRDAEPFSFASEIVFDQDQIWLKRLNADFAKNRSKTLQRELLEYLENHPGASKQTLAQALDENADSMKGVLRDMKSAGLVEMKQETQGSKATYRLTQEGQDFLGAMN